MTIVKPSSNKKRSSKQVVNKKLMRSADCSDVFSDIHVMKKKESESESENDASNDEENEGEEGESQAPKYKYKKTRNII
jgi:Ran GTPase-activating protein (RanGAP) involved in mRNA processing and transport